MSQKRGNGEEHCMFGPDMAVIVGQAVRMVAIDIGPIYGIAVISNLTAFQFNSICCLQSTTVGINYFRQGRFSYLDFHDEDSRLYGCGLLIGIFVLLP